MLVELVAFLYFVNVLGQFEDSVEQRLSHLDELGFCSCH